MCNNTSAMNMAKNSTQQKRTKNIDVRQHFLTENVEMLNVVMNFYKTEDQLEDMFNNALSKESFLKDRIKLGMLKIT